MGNIHSYRLTSKQKEVYYAIKAYWAAYKTGPSHRDLIKLTSYHSTSAVSNAIRRLSDLDLVTYRPDVARSCRPKPLSTPLPACSFCGRLVDIQIFDGGALITCPEHGDLLHIRPSVELPDPVYAQTGKQKHE